MTDLLEYQLGPAVFIGCFAESGASELYREIDLRYNVDL